MYDWTKFEIHFFINAEPEAVFDRWSTSEGLSSFFVKECNVTASDGSVRDADKFFSEGDEYKWEWFFDYSSSGKITRVLRNQLIEFTFGKCVVEVGFKAFEGGTLLHLRQSGMEPVEKDMVHIHLDCRGGWIYFLTNLKAVLEYGVDVRDKRPSTSMSLAIDFVPPV